MSGRRKAAQQRRGSLPILPDDDEVERIVLGPDSLVWQTFSDARLFLGAGYALMLQVAHPTVGSGVRDHSTFREDPWGRLLRTVDYLNLLVYGGREAAAMGRRLRDMHKPIKGTNPDGGRYHALEPEAYAWVHATLMEASFAAGERFVGRISIADRERMYAEYLPLGRFVGVRPGDLPETLSGFRDYIDTMIAERLEHTQSVDDVLEALDRPAPPGLPVIDQLWPLLRIAPTRATRIATVGLMPESLRRKLGLRWTSAQQTELRAIGAASRALTPLMPAQLRRMGPEVLRMRREAIARGPLGAGAV